MIVERRLRLVGYVIDSRGKPRRAGETHPHARHSDAIVAQAKAMHAQGVSYRDIARALGCGKSIVHAWCKGLRRAKAADKHVLIRERIK